MPVDYYPNKTVAQLEAILEQLQNRQLKGGVTEVTAAGVRTVRALGLGQSRPELEIRRVLYSLYLKTKDDNNAENRYPNPYAGRIRRTLPSYSGPAYS